MKNNKYTFFTFIFLFLSAFQIGFSQNAPGGNVTNANSFISALGGKAYSSYQAGVYTIYVTENIQLAAPINIINGFFKLMPADTTCKIEPANSISRLISIQTGANLTIQGKTGTEYNAYLKLEGKVSESAKCQNNILFNLGTLILQLLVWLLIGTMVSLNRLLSILL